MDRPVARADPRLDRSTRHAHAAAAIVPALVGGEDGNNIQMNHEGQMDERGESRASFLARVSRALGRPQVVPPAEPAPKVDERVVRLAGPDEDLATLFAQRAEEVGMNVQRVDAASAGPALRALLKRCSATRVVVGTGPANADLGIAQALGEGGVAMVDWQGWPGFEIQYDVDAGITGVHAALAETGTLICCSDACHSRGLSLVPPIHIAIVRAGDILPDMIDYWARLSSSASGELPSSQVLITGPSKTADIEGMLVTGVHGPGQVHVLLVAG
jgi:L-lactate dehydrogenase complex protein LldG